MSLWDAILGRRRVKLSLEDPANWNFGFQSHSGKTVNQDSAMTLSAVWACVRLRARVVGALGCGVYERTASGERLLARDHPLHQVVHESPNVDQTPAEFWGGMISCIDLWGNAYARILRGSLKQVVGLEPLRPDRMTVRRANGVRVYDYRDGLTSRRYRQEEIFHLRGFTLGGDVGLSAVSYGRHSLGIALAADETAGKTFANGLQVSGFVKMLQGVRLTKDQREQLIDVFAKFTGSSNAGKVMPLDGGMDFVPLNLKPEDAQLLQSRGFGIEDVGRWFDTPPILIGHAGEGQTMWGSGVEQIILGWIVTGLDPLFVGIQQAVSKQLLTPPDRSRFYAEFNRQALLRADSKGRAEFYSKVFGLAGITPNQIADRENMPRFEGGDGRYLNSTFVPLEQAGTRRLQPAPGEPID